MTEVGFYHLTRSNLEAALPRLLEKAYAAGNRVLVRGSDPERLELLNRALWTYGKDTFLPHGGKGDGFAEQQPIYLTVGPENPIGRIFVNRLVRPRLFPDDKARAWLRHNVEEVGNFEFFLPELYARRERPEAAALP